MTNKLFDGDLVDQAHDTTEELRRSEERYRKVFSSATDALFVFSLGPDGQPGRFTEANKAASEMLGYEREELLQLSPPDLVDPTERDRLPALFQELQKEKQQRLELLLVAKDGRRIPVEISGTLFDLESQPTVLGILRDITGKKRAEEGLRQVTASTVRQHHTRARRDRAVIASLCVLTLLASTYFNGFENLSAWVLKHRDIAVDEVVTTLVFLALSLIVYVFRRTREFDKEVAERNQIEEVLRVLQGELESRVQQRTAELSQANEALRVEIAEHERAEAMLRLQSAALNAAADAIVVTGRDGTIAWVNPAFTALTGYSADESTGKNQRELLKSGAQDQVFYKNLWDTILAGNVWRGETTNRRKDGTVYTEAMTITPVKDARGEVTHFVAIKRDLTDAKRLEAQFLQAQKMESVGRLAGGVAHDFNNLITVILGFSELIDARLAPGQPIRADVAEIRRAGERAAGLTRQLLAFSRRQVLQPTSLDLNEVVTRVTPMLSRLVGEDVTLRTTLQPGTFYVMADAGQIEQVIMNLAVNARDAMPNGGSLTIDTANVDLDDTFVRHHAGAQPGPHVMIAVSDTGTGMDAATQQRIFEPFFTTKGKNKGTGLGLSTVYGIVKQSGGCIWVDSEVGRGSTFGIYLPVTMKTVARAAALSAIAQLRGTETVLLAEDERAVRMFTKEILERNGYRVLDAEDSVKALSLARVHDGPIDLLLSDVILPNGSGADLFTDLARDRHDLRVLYMSGYTDDVILDHGVLQTSAPFLQKPFTSDALLQKVRAALDARQEVLA